MISTIFQIVFSKLLRVHCVFVSATIHVWASSAKRQLALALKVNYNDGQEKQAQMLRM